MSAALVGGATQKLSAPVSAIAGNPATQKLSGDRLQRRADQLELGRLAAGLSVQQLCGAAGVHRATYHRHVVAGGCGATVLARLERALASLRSKRAGAPDERLLVRATYGGFLVALCRELGIMPADVHAQDPRRGATADPAWRRLAHVRQAAIYLTNTAIVVKQRRLAEVLGLEPAAICLALKSVEDRRDDPAFDLLLDRLSVEVMGRDD